MSSAGTAGQIRVTQELFRITFPALPQATEWESHCQLTPSDSDEQKSSLNSQIFMKGLVCARLEASHSKEGWTKRQNLVHRAYISVEDTDIREINIHLQTYTFLFPRIKSHGPQLNILNFPGSKELSAKRSCISKQCNLKGGKHPLVALWEVAPEKSPSSERWEVALGRRPVVGQP